MKTKEYIEQLVSEISGNGCLIPTDLLTHNLQNLVDFAKSEQVIEETKRWADGLAKSIETIGQAITEPEDIILDKPKINFRVIQKSILADIGEILTLERRVSNDASLYSNGTQSFCLKNTFVEEVLTTNENAFGNGAADLPK